MASKKKRETIPLPLLRNRVYPCIQSKWLIIVQHIDQLGGNSLTTFYFENEHMNDCWNLLFRNVHYMNLNEPRVHSLFKLDGSISFL